MNQVVNMGPFMIQYRWIVDVIGIVAGYILLKILIKKVGKPEHKRIIDMLFNVILIPIAVWKFGPAVFHPMIVIKQPFSILYFSGNNLYFLVGCILSALYVWWRSRKDHIGLFVILDYFVLATVVFELISNLLMWKYGLPTTMPWGISIDSPDFKYHPINIYNLIIIFVIIFRVWLAKQEIGKGTYLSEVIFIFGVGEMVVSYFAYQGPTILFLSMSQWLLIGMVVTGLVLRALQNGKHNSHS